MKTKILLFLLAISFSAAAQKDKSDDFIPQFTHGIGVSMQKFDGLNGRIGKFSQYKKLDDYTGTLELGMLNEHHRVVSDMNLMIGSSLSGHSKGGSVIRYFGVNMGIGYDVLPSKNITLYPLAGLAFEGFQARFYKDNSSVPFDSLLQTPSAQSSVHSLDFTNYFFSYRFGFGISLRSDKHPGGSIGLQAYYTGSFSSHAWKTNQEQSLMNAPEDKLSQFHVGLILGRQMHNMKH
jgi:hypothetical protein